MRVATVYELRAPDQTQSWVVAKGPLTTIAGRDVPTGEPFDVSGFPYPRFRQLVQSRFLVPAATPDPKTLSKTKSSRHAAPLLIPVG